MDTTSQTPVTTDADDNDDCQDDGRFLHKIPAFLNRELTLLTRFTATISIWASCVLLLVSNVLFITAFSTVHWSVTERLDADDVSMVVFDVGLWQTCTRDDGCLSLNSNELIIITCKYFKPCQL